MVIKDWDNELIVTDNVLTNLPISRLSSVPIDTGGVQPDDLMLISKKCDDPQMTETGYMSYSRRFSDIAGWALSALGIDGMLYDIGVLSDGMGRILPYTDVLSALSGDLSVSLDVYDDHDEYNPYMVSAIYQTNGVITQLSGYRLSAAVDHLTRVYKFNVISAVNGSFDNLEVHTVSATDGVYTNLSVTNVLSAPAAAVETLSADSLVIGGLPYWHLSSMPDADYKALEP